MIIELMDCTNVLLDEIANKQFKQRDIAMTYALSLQSNDPTDYKKVNRAIIDRWSKSGLNRIKEMAWSGKCFLACNQPLNSEREKVGSNR